MWIVQEIHVSSADNIHIAVGNILKKWGVLENLCYNPERVIYEGKDDTYTQHDLFGSRMVALMGTLGSSDLLDFITRYHASLASEVRDKVFALLSVVQWPIPERRIRPDYDKSVFGVAVEALKHMAFSAGFSGLTRWKFLKFALNLDSSNADIAHVLAERRCQQRFGVSEFMENFVQERPDYAFPLGSPGTRTFVYATPEMFDCMRHAMEPYYGMWRCQIQIDTDGRLTAPIRTRTEVTTAKENNFREDSGNPAKPGTSVFMGSQVVCLVCNEARAGDHLVKDESAHYGPCTTGLVLRHVEHDLFMIVGQAIFAPGYAICPAESDCSCPADGGLQHEMCPFIFRIFFDIEDLLVFMCQDTGGAEFGRDFERLSTPVCRRAGSSYAVAVPPGTPAVEFLSAQEWRQARKSNKDSEVEYPRSRRQPIHKYRHLKLPIR